ncbi:hypothetical protein [Lysinibacillus sp. AR18-8]|uniref:hypothetical protein n=1 Tax=Lysinibacillus sp. AR18-8 TaxID=1889781 RepID=UPI00158691E2|nr:hypothetical protein [Lysinibacillus sp. AR18-8]
MEVEFFPKVTRLLENEASTLEIHYLNDTWLTPTIGVRPPYYSYPIYESYYPIWDNE